MTSSLALNNRGQNIDKLLAISQTPSILQTDRQTDLPSNFLKIARLLGKIKHTVSLRFIILYFGAKNLPLGGHVLTSNE